MTLPLVSVLTENHRLFVLAKQQNAKLYKFNMALKESADRHQKDLQKKDERFAQLKARIENELDDRAFMHDRGRMDEIRQMLTQHQLLDQASLD